MKFNFRKLIVFSVMFLFAFSFVVAQDPLLSVPVISSETSTQDFSATYTNPSETMGAIISQIDLLFREVITFSGIELFVSESGGLVDNFDLWIFPADTEVNFGTLTLGDVFQTSENAIIRGTNSTWTTYMMNTTVNAGENGQTPSIVNVPITYDDGVVIQPQSAGSYLCDGVTSPPTTLDCVSYDCPSSTELEAMGFAGAGSLTLYEVCSKYIFYFASVPSVAYWLGDIDGNELFEYGVMENQGYSVQSFETQALAIIPEDSYDLFVHII